ncbi:lipoxygenase family protein [Burkholderia alba]|uniref:lipoxygenase family protein n=1 Tax=Burkholderia alba TaxID=2683677 RepID=UPI002B05B867|nr:lipoxygenase family protein [Burkholderia alba]
MQRIDSIQSSVLVVNNTAVEDFADTVTHPRGWLPASARGIGPEIGRAIETGRPVVPKDPVPVLPHRDSVPGQLARARHVSSQKLGYTWTRSFPNTLGVPFAAALSPQDMPTADWLLDATQALAATLVNVLGALPGSGGAAWQPPLQAIRANIAAARSSYAGLQADPLAPAAALQIEHLQTTLLGVLASIDALAAGLVPRLDSLFPIESGTRSAANDSALFATIPLPELAYAFHRDDVFAQLRVGGQNPLLIRGVTTLPAKFPLTNAQYQQVMGPGDDLGAAGSEHRLYLLDYVDNGLLATTGPVVKPLTGVGYAYAPIALFAVPRHGTALVPVAIQCDQEPSLHPIFLRADPANTSASAYWAWQMAKTVVQSADACHHEMFAHLSRTHFVSEAFCMATHRNLGATHPLHALLMPHFEGTLFINEGIARIALSPAGFVDTLFAAPVRSAAQMVLKDRLAFDFYENMLPADLASRGVDDPAVLPDYPYRDDALLIWRALEQWAGDYVQTYYLSDADVTNDYELGAWTQDIMLNGKIKGFRPITSRAQLIDVLTMVIFTASAQHAAVSGSQPALAAYAPAASALLAAPAPTGTAGMTQSHWNAMLPPMRAAVERLALAQLPGGIRHRRLGQYQSNRFPYRTLLTDPRIAGSGGPLARFQAALRNIETTIAARNLARARPYPFLLPSRIAPSTHI